MRKASSRRIVIDASVARSAGGKDAVTTDPSSNCCRTFLASVLGICHRVVITQDIQQELNNHESRFARKWRLSMVARKKVVLLTDLPTIQTMRDAVEILPVCQSDKDAMLKDCHLIVAAQATDSIIASRDDEAQQLFAAHLQTLPAVADLLWVNPVKTPEDIISWLKNGALPDNRYQLKHYQPED